MSLYQHVRHPWADERARRGPVKAADCHPAASAYARFNRYFAVWTTGKVGTMTCAYAFAALALTSLPATIATHNMVNIVQWIAQTFFQLVLLSVILVGQNVQAEAADQRSVATYNDAEAIIHALLEVQNHLEAQDMHLVDQDGKLGGLIDQVQAVVHGNIATGSP